MQGLQQIEKSCSDDSSTSTVVVVEVELVDTSADRFNREINRE